MRKLTPAVAVIAFVLAGWTHLSRASQRLEDLVAPLDGGYEPLVTAFNADEGKARLVVVLSPN